MRDGYAPEKAQALFEKLSERLKTAGSVRSIALAAQAPFSIEDEDDATPTDCGRLAGVLAVQQSVIEETVGAGYFAALSEPMLAGREFEERDQRSQADGSKTFSLPVVLNETLRNADFSEMRMRSGSASGTTSDPMKWSAWSAT